MRERKWTTKSVIVVVVIAITMAVAATALAYDTRLDLAIQQLDTGKALLMVVDEHELSDPKSERKYSRELQAAIRAIETAQKRVEKAMVIADGG